MSHDNRPLLPIPLIVDCPRCGAIAGEPCVNDQGTPANHHHAVRTRAAEARLVERLNGSRR